MWVATTDFATAASHPFYTRLNRLLREHGFDDFAEGQCATFYADTIRAVFTWVLQCLSTGWLDQGQDDRHRRHDA